MTKFKVGLAAVCLGVAIVALIWRGRERDPQLPATAAMSTESPPPREVDSTPPTGAPVVTEKMVGPLSPANEEKDVRRDKSAGREPPKGRSRLEQGMVRVEDCQNAGRATPAATLETLMWAAMKGQIADVAATLELTAPAREGAEAWRASLSDEAREKYPTPESLPALFLAEELLRKAVSLEITEVVQEGAGRVTVRAMTVSAPPGGTGISKFPMKQTAEGWRLTIPGEMIEGMRRARARTSERHAP